MPENIYRFRPMSADDLPLVRRWLEAAHVREWWGDTLEQFELVSGDLNEPAMDQLIVASGDRPFAYLQCYDQTAWPENGLGCHPPGTRGSISSSAKATWSAVAMAPAFIRAFTDTLLAAGTPRVITDPDPANARAIRAYEKAGFRKQHEVDTPDGRSLLMVRNA